ncbi:MAG: hypothetical protein ABIH26_13385 [Candidatus Eisenbacteria bacterium]
MRWWALAALVPIGLAHAESVRVIEEEIAVDIYYEGWLDAANIERNIRRASPARNNWSTLETHFYYLLGRDVFLPLTEGDGLVLVFNADPSGGEWEVPEGPELIVEKDGQIWRSADPFVIRYRTAGEWLEPEVRRLGGRPRCRLAPSDIAEADLREEGVLAFDGILWGRGPYMEREWIPFFARISSRSESGAARWEETERKPFSMRILPAGGAGAALDEELSRKEDSR